MIRWRFIGWVSLLMHAVSASAATADKARTTKPPLVTVRKAASLQEALVALHTATDAAVVAEGPVMERSLAAAINDEPVDAALAKISQEFHLHAIQREWHLALVRRLSDPRERMELETSEIRAIVQDLYRLVSPFSPHFRDMKATLERNAFDRSLTNR